MNIDNLVLMANRIGEFFDAMPDRDEAREGISDHIRKFWAPRMRHQLAAHAAEAGVTGLSPIVIEALATHTILPVAIPVATADPAEAEQRHAFDGASEA